MVIAHRMRQYVAPLLACLGLGALLGWMVAGWPVQGASNAEPWDLRPVHQVRYVGAVAADYARTGDAEQVHAALAGWDAEALTEILALSNLQSPDPVEAQRLAALRDVLALPEAPWSWRTLLGDPYVRGGLGIAGGLLALAVGSALWPVRGALRDAGGRAAGQAAVSWQHLSADERRLLEQTLQAGDDGLSPTAVPEEASWEDVAQGVAAGGLQAAEGERVLPPAAQQAPTTDQPHQAPATADAKAATWQPQPPATDGRARPEGEAPGERADGQQTPPQPVVRADDEGTKAPVAQTGAASQSAPQPGQHPTPVAATPAPPEETTEAAVSVDAGLLDDLFQDEAEESMARHVLTRDLDEIDASALALQAGAIAEALAHGQRRAEER